jgi:hypothetical protein
MPMSRRRSTDSAGSLPLRLRHGPISKVTVNKTRAGQAVEKLSRVITSG